MHQHDYTYNDFFSRQRQLSVPVAHLSSIVPAEVPPMDVFVSAFSCEHLGSLDWSVKEVSKALYRLPNHDLCLTLTRMLEKRIVIAEASPNREQVEGNCSRQESEPSCLMSTATPVLVLWLSANEWKKRMDLACVWARLQACILTGSPGIKLMTASLVNNPNTKCNLAKRWLAPDDLHPLLFL